MARFSVVETAFAFTLARLPWRITVGLVRARGSSRPGGGRQGEGSTKVEGEDFLRQSTRGMGKECLDRTLGALRKPARFKRDPHSEKM